MFQDPQMMQKVSALSLRASPLLRSLLRVFILCNLPTSQLSANPKTAAFLNDAAFKLKLQQMQTNPQLAATAFQDPRMIQVMGVLMGVDLNAFERPEGSNFDPSNPGASAPPPPPAASSSSSSKPTASSSSSNESKPTPSSSAPPPKKSEPTPAPEPMEVDDEDSKAKAEAEKLKKQGNEVYKARKFEEAVELYEKAWETWPKDVSFLTNLAAVFFEQGEYDKAISTCEKAVEEGRELRADWKMIAKSVFFCTISVIPCFELGALDR
jgi:stress-induced-phosphoprotein 1